MESAELKAFHSAEVLHSTLEWCKDSEKNSM